MPGKRVPEDVRREQILEAAFGVALREGIGSLTIRAVAAEASVSHGLVLFHFGRKELLVHELLDWIIATHSVLHVSPEVAGVPGAPDRLHALLRQEMARLSHEPGHARLFLEYWALGARDEQIRVRVSGELERYRAAFRDIMEELLGAEPAAFVGVTSHGLAALGVSWIYGCAVQVMIDPAHFDVDEYLGALRGLVGPLLGRGPSPAP